MLPRAFGFIHRDPTTGRGILDPDTLRRPLLRENPAPPPHFTLPRPVLRISLGQRECNRSQIQGDLQIHSGR